MDKSGGCNGGHGKTTVSKVKGRGGGLRNTTVDIGSKRDQRECGVQGKRCNHRKRRSRSIANAHSRVPVAAYNARGQKGLLRFAFALAQNP